MLLYSFSSLVTTFVTSFHPLSTLPFPHTMSDQVQLSSRCLLSQDPSSTIASAAAHSQKGQTSFILCCPKLTSRTADKTHSTAIDNCSAVAIVVKHPACSADDFSELSLLLAYLDKTSLLGWTVRQVGIHNDNTWQLTRADGKVYYARCAGEKRNGLAFADIAKVLNHVEGRETRPPICKVTDGISRIRQDPSHAKSTSSS